jgi:predicted nucleic acid-binding protein
MLVIDSNIWAYYFDVEAREHPHITGPVEKALTSEKIAINTVIMIEVAHFLVKNLGSILGKEKLSFFLGFPFTVIDLDYDLTLRAIDLLARYSQTGIGGRDATILATAEATGANRIMTHDEAFKRVSGLDIIDPIPQDAEPKH